jgi:hypothetical protein
MSPPATEASRPGVSVGSTSEFTLFFHVKPGHADDVREALRVLQGSPGYRPGDYELPIASIHEARFVLFDDDTRAALRDKLRRPLERLHGGLRVPAAAALRRDLPARRGL